MNSKQSITVNAHSGGIRNLFTMVLASRPSLISNILVAGSALIRGIAGRPPLQSPRMESQHVLFGRSSLPLPKTLFCYSARAHFRAIAIQTMLWQIQTIPFSAATPPSNVGQKPDRARPLVKAICRRTGYPLKGTSFSAGRGQ